MSYLADTSRTWGLEDASINAERFAEFQQAEPKLILRRPPYAMLQVGDAFDGGIALIEEVRQSIEVYVSIHRVPVIELDMAASELRIWRSLFCTYAPPVSHKVFLEIVLPVAGTIISAPVTEGSARIWSKVSAIAADIGHRVGFIIEGRVVECDDPKRFSLWYREHTCWPRRYFVSEGRP